MNWTLLQNSLLVSGCVTLGAVLLGFMTALGLATVRPRARKIGLALSAIALALPPFLVVNCWLHYLGLTGVWREWLPLDLFSLGGTVWVLTLLTWPITTWLTLGAWQRLEAAHWEAEPELHGWVFVRWLLWPMARGAVAQAALLTFVLVLNHFAVPAILQVKVLPAELWVSFNTTFNYAEALTMLWPLIIGPLVLLLYLRPTELVWSQENNPALAVGLRRQLGKPLAILGVVVAAILFILSVGLPLFQLASTERTWVELPGALAAGTNALGHSLLFAAVTASITIFLGVIFWRARWVQACWLFFWLPGVVLGMAMIFLLNRPVLAVVYQSVAVVLLAFGLRYLALGWNVAARALRSLDGDLADAARLSGANRWQIFWRVQWPQIASPLAAGWYVIYLLCLWDVETLVLIVPPGGETLAMRVFNLLHYGHNAQVNALCLILLALAILPLGVWAIGRLCLNSLNWRQSTVWLGLPLLLATMGCDVNTDKAATLRSSIFARAEVIGTRGTGLGQFNKPRTLAVDAQDNLYVVDMTGRVQKFSPKGEFLQYWQMPQTDLGRPKGMCQDERGNIVLIEPHYSRVNHFSPDGKLVRQWGKHGTNTGLIAFPRSAVVNARGEIYVSEYGVVDRVQRFSPQGAAYQLGWGKAGTGDGEFNRPEGLGIDATGQIYVADSCNHRVQVFSGDGKFLRTFGKAGTGAGELSYPFDVRLDKGGHIFVCEFGNSRIQIFDGKGQVLETLGGIGAAPGQLSNPWSITLDSHGNLYVADAGNHRVQKFIRREQVAMLSVGATSLETREVRR